jgi:thiol-disulfide isomerase/thioredoxin
MLKRNSRIGQMKAVAIVFAAIVAGSFSPAVAADSLPRYKFQVGQELVYRITEVEDLLRKENADNRPKAPDTEVEWRVYVVRENEDGSWRLLVRRRFKSYSLDKEKKPKVNFENDFLGYVDLNSDGTYAKNDSLGDNPIFWLQPHELFPRLPSDDAALQVGWQYDDPTSAEHYAFQPVERVGEKLTLTAAATAPDDANYESTETLTYQFDSDRGQVTRREREAKASWEVNPWHVRAVKELVEQKEHDAEWIAAFSSAADVYLKADRRWWTVMGECDRSRNHAEAEELLNDMEATLQELADAATIQEFKELYASRLALHERDGKWALEDVDERAELYARDPVDWETTDFEEQPQRLVDYRGKVVVLDFWYRGCGHCIKALPKIKALAAKYADRPVAVLGVNNDKEDANARHVIETFELKYPSIRNGEISKSYGVDTWPTLIVLDQSGRVALFHAGNSTNLVDEVSRTVDELLAKPVASSVPAQATSSEIGLN